MPGGCVSGATDGPAANRLLATVARTLPRRIQPAQAVREAGSSTHKVPGRNRTGSRLYHKTLTPRWPNRACGGGLSSRVWSMFSALIAPHPLAVGLMIVLAVASVGNVWANVLGETRAEAARVAAGCKVVLMPALAAWLASSAWSVAHRVSSGDLERFSTGGGAGGPASGGAGAGEAAMHVGGGIESFPTVAVVAIITGVLCGWVGDVLLIGHRPGAILFGGIAFAVGHLCYCAVAITLLAKAQTLGSAIGVALLVWALCVLAGARYMRRFTAGSVVWAKLKVGISAYGILLCCTAGLLAGVAADSPEVGPASVLGHVVGFGGREAIGAALVAAVGGISFVASDVLLSANVFGGENRWRHGGVMATYIFAQITIGWGLYVLVLA